MKININPKQQVHLVIILIALVIIGFGVKKIIEWQKERIRIVENSINETKEKMNLADEIKEYSSRAEKSLDKSWKTKETVVIMGEISGISSKYDIEILNINPGGTKDAGLYNVFNLSLNIRADYFMLVRFISAIERLKTVTKITVLDLSPEGSADSAEENSPRMVVNLSIEAFILK